MDVGGLPAIVMTYALIGDEPTNAADDCANRGTLAVASGGPNYRSGSGAATYDGGGSAGMVVAIVVSAAIIISAAIEVSASIVVLPAIVVVAVLVTIARNILGVTVVLVPIVAVLGGLSRDCDGGQSQTEDAENRDAKNAFHNYLRL
jgi:hypothetical protein